MAFGALRGQLVKCQDLAGVLVDACHPRAEFTRGHVQVIQKRACIWVADIGHMDEVDFDVAVGYMKEPIKMGPKQLA